jgi:hypothetical protein
LESIFRRPDLSDILLQVRSIIILMPENFKEYCKDSGKSAADPTSKIDYQKEIKTVIDLKKIFGEKDMVCLPYRLLRAM